MHENKTGKTAFPEYLIRFSGFCIVLITFIIMIFLVYKGTQLFTTFGHSVFDFIFSSDWSPADTAEGGGSVGAAAYISGTLVTSFLALLITVPLTLVFAVYVNEIADKKRARQLRSGIEIFAGIPSVIYGWIGLTVLVPFIKDLFNLSFGYSLLAAVFVLAMMIFPISATVACEGIAAVPLSYKKAAYALGSTPWQTIYKITIPAAKTRIITGFALALARAFGEALAVAMVIGKTRTMPTSLLGPATTMTAAIASDTGSAAEGGEFNAALWSMALFLFILSGICVLIIRKLSQKELQSSKA